jgi:hypothetical protein
MKYVIALTIVAIAGIVSGRAGDAATLGVAGRSNQHATAAAAGTFVALAWAGTSGEASTDIYLAVSRNGGAAFSAPVRVNATAGEAHVGGEQPPRVALVSRPAGEPEIVVVWRAKRGTDTRLLTARSTDGGRTFGKSLGVPGAAGPGNRGWQSVDAGPDGHVSVLWLDHRDIAAGPTAADGHHHDTGASAPAESVARAQLSQLYFAALDGSAQARALARGVCYCCKTAVASDGDSIYAAWRHVYAGSHRDIAVAVSRDRGRTFSDPVRVSADNWQIDGCPENGPALVVDTSHRVHVVWPTLVATAGRQVSKLFHAMAADGRVFTPREEIATSSDASHPQAAVAPDGSLLVVWDELVSGRRRVRLATRHAPSGGSVLPRIETRTLSEPPASATYPVIVVTPTRAVVAWSSRVADRSTIEVRRIEY